MLQSLKQVVINPLLTYYLSNILYYNYQHAKCCINFLMVLMMLQIPLDFLYQMKDLHLGSYLLVQPMPMSFGNLFLPRTCWWFCPVR